MSMGISGTLWAIGAGTAVAGAYGANRANAAAGDAADASLYGAELTADAQQASLDYLKEQNQLPTELRDQALTGLGDYFQIPGEQLNQQQLIDQAYASPLYNSIVSTQNAGEDSILRNASLTGGLRSGGSQNDLFEFNQQLHQDALLTAYNEQVGRQDYERALNLSGVQGLAGLDGNQNAIADLTSAVGATRGQGQIAAGQARQQGVQNSMDNMMGVAGLGLQGYGAYMASDIRLKTDIKFQEVRNGLPWYTWEWNEAGEGIGLTGSSEGVLAHQVYEVFPEAVSVKDGFIAVNYEKLGFGEKASA